MPPITSSRAGAALTRSGRSRRKASESSPSILRSRDGVGGGKSWRGRWGTALLMTADRFARARCTHARDHNKHSSDQAVTRDLARSFSFLFFALVQIQIEIKQFLLADFFGARVMK